MRVELDHLGKVYENGVIGLRDLNLEICPGIFGLLGPNGAGKTTLMRILATLLSPSSGGALVGGFDVRRQRPEVRSILGYLPQNPGFYPQLTVQEYLDYIGLLYGLPLRERRKAVQEVIDRVNLSEQRNRRTAHLSGGMKQRLGIAQAVISKPKLIIVDEPTAGLDPEERIRVRTLLTELAGERVVILSTHIVADVAGSANELGVLRRGELIFQGSPSSLVASVEGKVWWVDLPEAEIQSLSRRAPVTDLERRSGGVRARVLSKDPVGLGATSFEPAPANLEDAYIWIMGDAGVASTRLDGRAVSGSTAERDTL